MTKQIKIILVALAGLLCLLPLAGCSPVSRYYLLTVSSSGVEIKGAGSFASDDDALASLEARKAQFNEGILKQIKAVDVEAPDADIRLAALDRLRSEVWALVRVTCSRSFDPDEALRELPKIWNKPQELRAYCEKNKIEVVVFTLP